MIPRGVIDSVRAPVSLPALVLAACTSTSPAPTPSPTPTAAVTESKADPTPAPPPGSCEARIAEYLSERAAASHCERDSDCAEMWPGLCPHGPYYIHREADIAPVIAAERAIESGCEIPECEPPMELGIAHCEAGKCAPGRATANVGARKSCWDFRETYLEANGTASAQTEPVVRSTTGHLVIVPATAGTLVLEIDWPTACTDCRIAISEHNSGMAHPKTPTGTSSAAERNGEPVRRERVELPVTPGPYHMIGQATVAVPFTIRADLRDAGGAPGKVTRHGVGWQAMCED